MGVGMQMNEWMKVGVGVRMNEADVVMPRRV